MKKGGGVKKKAKKTNDKTHALVLKEFAAQTTKKRPPGLNAEWVKRLRTAPQSVITALSFHGLKPIMFILANHNTSVCRICAEQYDSSAAEHCFPMTLLKIANVAKDNIRETILDDFYRLAIKKKFVMFPNEEFVKLLAQFSPARQQLLHIKNAMLISKNPKYEKSVMITYVMNLRKISDMNPIVIGWVASFVNDTAERIEELVSSSYKPYMQAIAKHVISDDSNLFNTDHLRKTFLVMSMRYMDSYNINDAMLYAKALLKLEQINPLGNLIVIIIHCAYQNQNEAIRHFNILTMCLGNETEDKGSFIECLRLFVKRSFGLSASINNFNIAMKNCGTPSHRINRVFRWMMFVTFHLP